MADAPQDRPGDLVDRDFGAAAPNRLWVVDFTYVGTGAGTVYTALVIDAFSRMIVGWRTAGHHRMTLVLDALVMAVAARRREGVSVAGAIHHSDAGSEYLAIRYGRELTAAGMTPSVGSVGDSDDNALAESVIGLYKSEVIAHQGPWRDLAQVEAATAAWARWFNQQRLFWPIGRRPPAEYEQAFGRPRAGPGRPHTGPQETRQDHQEDQEDHVKEAAWPPLAYSGGLRPSPLGRCPRPRPSSEMGQPPERWQEARRPASPRRVVIDATEPPARSRAPSASHARGASAPPCPVRGTGGTTSSCPTKRCQPPLRATRAAAAAGRANTHHHGEQMFGKNKEQTERSSTGWPRRRRVTVDDIDPPRQQDLGEPSLHQTEGGPARPYARSGPARPGCGRYRAPAASCTLSNATVRSPRQLTPGTRGGASGPATTSNSAFSGAGAEPPPHIPQRLLRHRRQPQAIQPRGQLPPHLAIPQAREQPQRHHEIHPHP